MLLRFETPDGPIWIAPDKIEMVTFPAFDYERVSEDKYVDFPVAGCCVIRRLGDQEIVIGTPDEVVAKINAALDLKVTYVQGGHNAGIL